MDCLKCGASIPEENAVYCGECGARLDGKKVCPSCEGLIDEKYAYCIYCGARADGKEPCKGCGTYFDGAFCSNCGTPAQVKKSVSAPVKASAAKTEEKPKNPVWKTIFAWIRSGAGLACVCFALIFVFLIGYDLSARALGETVGSMAAAEDKKLWYFFGDVYKELKDFKQAGAFKSDIPAAGLTIYAIMGTVLSAATLLGVVGCAIPAIIGFVKFATTRVENNGAKWGVRAALVYIGGAFAMYALDAIMMEMSVSGESVKAILLMDDATKAGIAICIVFLAIYAAGNLVRKGKEWKSGKTIAKFVLTACAAAFAIIVIAVDKSGLVGFKMTESGSVIEYALAQQYSNIMLVTIAEGAGVAFYNNNLGLISTSFAFSLVQQIMLIATIACAAILLLKGIFSTEENVKGKMCLSILLLVFAVVQMVSGIVCQNSMNQLMVNMANSAGSDLVEYNLVLGAAIVTVVFAVLNLGVQIASKVVEKKETVAEIE